MGMQEYDDDSGGGENKGPRRFDEFDCPECNANNPYGDGFRVGEEIRCYYCGAEFLVRVDDNNKLKLKPL